jgi:hypothetical protein
MIDAAPEGTTFHLAARTYRFSTPIVPKAGDRLIGAGAGVTVLDGGGSGSNGIDTMGGIADVIVADLTVTGFNDGIRIGPAWQVTGVEAMGNVTGLQFAGFAGATITDASAHDNGRFGIHGSSDQGRVIAFNSSSTLVQGNVISAPSSIDMLVRFMGNGRLEEGVEFMNAHNRAVGNTVTLAPGQSVGVIRTGGTTIDNLFRDNVYRVASLTDPSFAWWDGSEMREVDWMTWTSVYGQDLRGTASTMP